jgi:hypothetical protein
MGTGTDLAMAASDITLIGARPEKHRDRYRVVVQDGEPTAKDWPRAETVAGSEGWMGSSRRSWSRFEAESAQIVATFTTRDNSVSNVRIRGQLGPWMFDLKPAQTEVGGDRAEHVVWAHQRNGVVIESRRVASLTAEQNRDAHHDGNQDCIDSTWRCVSGPTAVANGRLPNILEVD